jgi:hypothetical protein
LQISAKEYLENKFISIYKPLTYIDSNKLYENSLGVYKYIQRYNKNIGKHFDTIVETNPKSLTKFYVDSKGLNKFQKVLN